LIAEVIAYFFTKAPKWAKNRGLVYESIAIGSRFNRQRTAWQEHLSNSQDEIRNFLKGRPKIKRVLVLGSGHLLDFPVDLIVNSTDHYWGLADAVHPKAVQKLVKKNPSGAELIHQDLVHINKNDLIKWDAIVSCCLASQLPLSLTADEKRSAEIIEEHFSILRETALPVLIITDFERHLSFEKKVEDKTPTIKTQIETSLFNAKLNSKPSRTWFWNLAPLGEVSKDYSLRLNVGVWIYNLPV
jgi:hypothetical protein